VRVNEVETTRNERKPEICFVAPNLTPLLFTKKGANIAGGAEFRQRILARALIRRGFRVCLVTLDRGERLTESSEGIRVFYSHSPEGGWPVIRFIHPRLTSWWRALRQADADIYFQSTAGFLTLVVGCFCRWHGRRFLYSAAHDLDFQPRQLWRIFQRRAGWRDRLLYQWGVRLAHAIVAQHHGQVSDCMKWYKREPVEIPNCYDWLGGEPAKSDGVVLWVSTIRKWKRPELFLELARQLPHLRFRMIGGPGDSSELPLFETIRAEASRIPNLAFVGFVPVDEVERHFDEARVFVNTSDFEGFPNTFLQSWARRIPTVSFIAPCFRDGNKGIGVICRDLGEMKTALTELCENDERWAAEGIKVREQFLKFHSVKAAVDSYTQLFDELMQFQRT
jgi:glycosyltransferase involved in cell wall biosynthesis